jgi:RND superfamily putative drug exporter
MRLAGEANWWAPPFMRKLHNRFGLSESESPAPQPVPERMSV